MNKLLLLVAQSCVLAALGAPLSAPAASPFPLQLETRVPFDPTAYPSRGHTLLMYELYLTNFSNEMIELRSIEILDADEPAGKPLARFEAEQIHSLLQITRSQASDEQPNQRQVIAFATAVLFMEVRIDTRARLPARLKHRVITTDSSIEGAIVGTHHTELKVLLPPLRAGTWHAYDGPSNDHNNHHRRGLLVIEGRPSISRRYATDWFLIKNGVHHEGDERNKHSYYSYSQPVFAVANGTIVTARDGMPDNVPGPVETFRPAIANTLETVTGNAITIDLGAGQSHLIFTCNPAACE